MSAEVLPKPRELLALHDVTDELFDTLRRWFDVPDSVRLDLSSIDAVVHEMADPVMIAALAMRKLQALHLLATPGVRTSTDVVITIVQDLARALLQAPVMRLRVQAERTDWDAALADLEEGAVEPAPTAPAEDDLEAERFEELHAALHDAVRAVLDASDGEIVYFE
jgi:hypothetical protein